MGFNSAFKGLIQSFLSLAGNCVYFPRAQKKSNTNDNKRDAKDSNVKVTSREGKKQRELIHWPSSSHQAVLRSMKQNPRKTHF